MTTRDPPDDGAPDDFIDAVARLLDLPIEPGWKPAIRTHLAVAMRLAALVSAFDLADEAEPAPVFRA